MTLGSGIAIAGIWVAVAVASFVVPVFAVAVVLGTIATWLVAFSGK